MSYEPCPLRLFGLWHVWATRYWDKFGTGKSDAPYQMCKYCFKIREAH